MSEQEIRTGFNQMIKAAKATGDAEAVARLEDQMNGYWACDCGRECRKPGGLPDCRATWIAS